MTAFERAGVSWGGRHALNKRPAAGTTSAGEQAARSPAAGPSFYDGFHPDGNGSGGVGNLPCVVTGGREAAPVLSLCAWCAPPSERPNTTHVMCDRCRAAWKRDVAGAVLVVANAPALYVLGAFMLEVTR